MCVVKGPPRLLLLLVCSFYYMASNNSREMALILKLYLVLQWWWASSIELKILLPILGHQTHCNRIIYILPVDPLHVLGYGQMQHPFYCLTAALLHHPLSTHHDK